MPGIGRCRGSPAVYRGFQRFEQLGFFIEIIDHWLEARILQQLRIELKPDGCFPGKLPVHRERKRRSQIARQCGIQICVF